MRRKPACHALLDLCSSRSTLPPPSPALRQPRPSAQLAVSPAPAACSDAVWGSANSAAATDTSCRGSVWKAEGRQCSVISRCTRSNCSAGGRRRLEAAAAALRDRATNLRAAYPCTPPPPPASQRLPSDSQARQQCRTHLRGLGLRALCSSRLAGLGSHLGGALGVARENRSGKGAARGRSPEGGRLRGQSSQSAGARSRHCVLLL